MKASELRLGNLVNIYKGNKIGLDENCLVESVAVADVNGFDEDDVEPIPLTEEWLIRLGFTLDKDDIHVLSVGRRAFSLVYVDQLRCVDVNYQNDIGGDWCQLPEVEYVHQLQNLCSVLTGEELKTNRTMNRRNLSGVYIFHKFDDEEKREPTCFEDCPEEKQDEWLKTLNLEATRNLAKQLGKRLRTIGVSFDIVSG